jgi:prepilin-type N-terminal cleavage/methylation domain-containing protein/prepilin-type processing-associated H-X9-DG protein
MEGTESTSCVPRPRGFTLVELLVVIAIIGVLIALLLPAVQAAREAARRTSCQNNLKQISLGILNYESATKWFPAAYNNNDNGYRRPAHNFVQFILPYVEQQAIYDLIDFKKNWNLLANKRAVENDLPMFICPSTPGERRWMSDYGTCELIDPSAYNPLISGRHITQRTEWWSILRRDTIRGSTVKDGLSNSFLLFEDAGRPEIWRGRELIPPKTPNDLVTGARWADDDNYFWIHDVCNVTSMFNCNNNNEIYAFHTNGANFAFGDGSVRFFTPSINPEAFVSLFTCAAGDSASSE